MKAFAYAIVDEDRWIIVAMFEKLESAQNSLKFWNRNYVCREDRYIIIPIGTNTIEKD